MSPNSNDNHLYMILKGIHRDIGKSHVKTEEEIGIVVSQTTGGDKLSGKYYCVVFVFSL